MRQLLEQRLQSLKAEFEAGQKMLADLEAQQASVQNTLLRISGAIQVLEEVLEAAPAVGENGNQLTEMMASAEKEMDSMAP